MIREARGFGATVNEAREDAIAKLGAGIDEDVQFEVVTAPKKKFLGIFGGCDAEVKAYIEMPETKKKEKKQPNNKKPSNKSQKPAEQKKAEAAADIKKDSKPQKAASSEQKEEKPVYEATSAVDDYKDAVDESQIKADSPTGRAIAYLKTILASLGCENTSFKAAVKENGAFIVLDGEDLGVIIGHRGETLDALQYLSSLVANAGGGYFKISLNIGNYREKREQTLIGLANRVSQQVLKSGRSRGLEPMNPYERRIIHTAVQNIEGVVSSSVGEGDRRRVIISPKNGANRPAKYSGGRNDRDRRAPRKPSATVSSEPSREPKKDSDVPLYGKIN